MRTSYSLAAMATALLLPLTAAAAGISVMVEGQTIVFMDVSQSAWFAGYVHDAAEAGIVSGYRDKNGKLTGKFGPENSVTVAEMLKIASESAGYDEDSYGAVINSGVKHWASAYLSVAKGEHFPLMDTRLRLDTPATRAQVASAFASAFRVNMSASPSGSTFTDVKLATEFATSIEALARDGVVSGDTDSHGEVLGTFRPSDPVNRAEVVKIALGARAKYGMPGQDRHPETNASSAAAQDQTLVRYTDTGFTPSVLSVPVETTVTFRNDSNTDLWVASSPHPTHTGYPGFDSMQKLLSGQTYMFKFTKIGTWSYHNHLSPSDSGTISVK